MSTKLKRVTFTITAEIEASLKLLKKERFYDCSQSEMIRTLVSAGVKSLEIEKTIEEDKNEEEA